MNQIVAKSKKRQSDLWIVQKANHRLEEKIVYFEMN